MQPLAPLCLECWKIYVGYERRAIKATNIEGGVPRIKTTSIAEGVPRFARDDKGGLYSFILTLGSWFLVLGSWFLTLEKGSLSLRLG